MDSTTAFVADLFRRESGRLCAVLAAQVGPARIDAVEDAVQDALVAAMRRWPVAGVPRNPAGWLYRSARNALVDRLRRARFEAALPDEDLQRALDAAAAGQDQFDAALAAVDSVEAGDPFADERLRLLACCCHPALSPGTQLALTLRLACGLGVEEIGRALLIDPATVAQRIVRGKRELRERAASLELPPLAELAATRGESIRHAIYLLFDAGYLNEGEGEWLRPAICADALRLARLLASHPATASPPAEALAALLCLCAARLPARSDAEGRPVPLARQDRSRWDPALIAEGYRRLERSIGGKRLSRYHIEAAIAAAHARAPSLAATDWAEIVEHYDQLCARFPGPAARLNRIVALGHARGAAAALAELQAAEALRGGEAGLAALEGGALHRATRAALLDALHEPQAAERAWLEAAERAPNPTIAGFFRARASESADAGR